MNDFGLAFDFSGHHSLRIGVIADTHGKLHTDIAEFISQCDIALHAGDIMGAAPLHAMQPRLGHTFAVKGNNDAHTTWHENDHPLLDEIPDLLELKLPGGKLVMEHSHRFWDQKVDNIHHSLRSAHPDAHLIIYGHTHIRTVDDSTQPMIANPGAAGSVRVHEGPSCLQLDVNHEEWVIQEHLFQVQ